MSYEFADGYKIRDQGGLHFVTFTVVGWIDLFSRKLYRDIFLENLQYCRTNKNLKVGAYVMMTNHIHLIVQSDTSKLSDTIRDVKSYSTKRFLKAINAEPESRREWLLYMFSFYANNTNRNDEFKIWTGNNHPEQITSKDFLISKLNYIHENPVRSGMVAKPEDYIYSSASNYVNGSGFFEIDFLF
jgi:putative transposase